MPNEALDESEQPLCTWVVEGVLDLPFQLPPPTRATVNSLFLNLGPGVDGFVQLRPRDPARASSTEFWSASDPVVYECRAGVKAPSAVAALLRGEALYEHVADRMTLLSGYPTRVLSIPFAYNEDELLACIAAGSGEYDATSSGEYSVRLAQPKNVQVPELLRPPEEALEAIRWFRHAMTQERPIDQFLGYHIALESIARHITGIERGPRRAPDGSVVDGQESIESAAIRFLAQRHTGLAADTRQELAHIRARIAHGSTDVALIHLAFSKLPLVQRLAADGIAIVLGIVPEGLHFLQPRIVEWMAPILRARYSTEDHPLVRWGKPLSVLFKQAVPPNPTE